MALNAERIRELASQEDPDIPPMTPEQAEILARLLEAVPAEEWKRRWSSQRR